MTSKISNDDQLLQLTREVLLSEKNCWKKSIKAIKNLKVSWSH